MQVIAGISLIAAALPFRVRHYMCASPSAKAGTQLRLGPRFRGDDNGVALPSNDALVSSQAARNSVQPKSAVAAIIGIVAAPAVGLHRPCLTGVRFISSNRNRNDSPFLCAVPQLGRIIAVCPGGSLDHADVQLSAQPPARRVAADGAWIVPLGGGQPIWWNRWAIPHGPRSLSTRCRSCAKLSSGARLNAFSHKPVRKLAM